MSEHFLGHWRDKVHENVHIQAFSLTLFLQVPDYHGCEGIEQIVSSSWRSFTLWNNQNEVTCLIWQIITRKNTGVWSIVGNEWWRQLLHYRMHKGWMWLKNDRCVFELNLKICRWLAATNCNHTLDRRLAWTKFNQGCCDRWFGWNWANENEDLQRTVYFSSQWEWVVHGQQAYDIEGDSSPQVSAVVK